MNISYFFSVEDVVNFCYKRSNPTEANQIIKKHKEEGLSKRGQLDTWLQEGKYIPVLERIWAERDREARLLWLREKKDALHAPLLYELAAAELKSLPTIETYDQIAAPLIKLANARVAQDAVCSDDKSVGAAVGAMEFVYGSVLINLLEKSGVSENIRKESSEKRVENIRNTLKTAMEEIINGKPLPDPKWVFYHGAGKYLGGMHMVPEEQYAVRRIAKAQEILKAVSNG